MGLGVAAERHGGQPLYDAADKVLDRLYPAVQGFWSGYMTTAKIADAAALLERSVTYAGARLIQTAFERSQTSHSLGPPEYLRYSPPRIFWRALVMLKSMSSGRHASCCEHSRV